MCLLILVGYFKALADATVFTLIFSMLLRKKRNIVAVESTKTGPKECMLHCTFYLSPAGIR